MTQVIEAKAILSAADKTGGVFASIAAKIRGMNAAASAANRSAMASGAAVAAAHKGNAGIAAKIGGMSDTALMAASRIAAPAAIAVAAGAAVKRYADIDIAMKRIGITADATDEDISKFHKSLRQVAQDNSLPFDKVKEGMDSLIAGGMELGKANEMIGSVSKTAQASGAEVSDLASTVLSLNQNAEIGSGQMQQSLDMLAKAGKEGKFELKDMARYLPEILPSAAAVGVKGVEGVQKMAAALQTMRLGAGTSEAAARNMMNVFSKIDSEQTRKKFLKFFDVNLPKSMEKAKKSGQDTFEAFMDITEKTIGGDMGKLPMLFEDMQVQAGMRAMLMYRKDYERIKKSIGSSAGTIDTDLGRILDTPAAKMAKMKDSADRLVESIGHGLVVAFDKASNAGSKLFGGEGKAGGAGLLNKIAESIDYATEKGGLQNIFKDEISKAKEENLQSAADGRLNHLENAAKAPELWGGEGSATFERLQEELGKARIKKFDVDAGKGAGSATEGGLFSDAEVAKWKHFLPPQIDRNAVWGDVPPRDKLYGPLDWNSSVPMPTRDPRKGFAMPAVQDLDMPAPNYRRASQDIPPAMQAAAPAAPQNVKVESTVTGQATVDVQVQPSGELISIAQQAKQATIELKAGLSALGAAITSANRSSRMGNGPGSTGVSSPDARPNTGIGGQ